MTELLSCPFCGGVEIEIRPNNIGDYYAICYSNDPSEVACGASTSDRSCETPEGAARRWNDRAEPGWQPIESGLPGKGLRVLVARTDGHVTIAARTLGGEFFDGFGQHIQRAHLTHWRSLTTPPVEAVTPAHAELSPGNSSDLRGEEG